jgi:hypothetical protein
MSEEEAYEAAFGEAGMTGEAFPIGTTNSWRKKGIESMKPIYDMLVNRQNADVLYNRGRQFQDAYDNTPTPEEISDFQRDKKITESDLRYLVREVMSQDYAKDRKKSSKKKTKRIRKKK